MRRAALCLALLLALAACQSPEQQARERLQNQVSSVRDAAEAGDLTAAAQRLDNLRVSVTQMHQEGLVDEEQAERILTAAMRVQANLAFIAPPLVPPPPPAPARVEPPSNSGGSVTGEQGPPGDRGEKGERGERGEKGRENGNGNGEGDGDRDD